MGGRHRVRGAFPRKSRPARATAPSGAAQPPGRVDILQQRARRLYRLSVAFTEVTGVLSPVITGNLGPPQSRAGARLGCASIRSLELPEDFPALLRYVGLSLALGDLDALC